MSHGMVYGCCYDTCQQTGLVKGLYNRKLAAFPPSDTQRNIRLRLSRSYRKEFPGHMSKVIRSVDLRIVRRTFRGQGISSL